MEKESRYALSNAETVNQALKELPVASEEDILTKTGKAIPFRKAIVVDGKVISIMSKPYRLIQHEQAFRPIVEGVTLRGIENFQYSVWADNKKANFAMYVGEGEDGVKFGFRAINSFDGSNAIKFGFSAYRRIEEARIVEKEHVLVWTMRQVCSNGAVIRVPLKTCKYLDVEKVVLIKSLLQENTRILHLGNVDRKLEAVQYVTEAFLLLKDPLNMMIIDAQNHTLTPAQARELIKKYVGKRRLDKYMEQFGKEEQTLWGLFNSMTYLASHGVFRDSVRDSILDKASNLLEAELLAQPQEVN